MTAVVGPMNTDFIPTLDHHEAVDRLRLANRGCGFTMSITRTKHDTGVLKLPRKVFLRCWKSRRYKSSSTGIRKPHTRSTGCPWRATLTREETGYRFDIKHTEHNHELDLRPTPDRKVSRRQKLQAPHRALAAMTAYPVPGAPDPLASAPGPSPYMPQAYTSHGTAAVPLATPEGQTNSAPYAPGSYAQHPGVSAQQATASLPQQTMTMPAYTTASPPRSPGRGAAVAGAPPAPAAPGRHRRKGYTIMSDIKRYQFPQDQRRVMTVRNPFRPEVPCFVAYQDSFNEILGTDANLLIAYEENFPFAHGAGIYSPTRDEVYVTSRQYVPPDKIETTVMISKLTRQEDDSWVRKKILTLAVLCNGGVNYQDENLLFCAQGDYRDPGGIVHIEADYPHKMSMMLNNYLGRKFNSLNDVTIHSDGSIWFTDPMYGFDQGLRHKPELPNQIYRFDPKTGDVRVMADGFGRPKCISFDPAESTVYITDNDAIQGNGAMDKSKSATIYAYDVLEKSGQPWLINRRVFAMPDTGVPDGVKCDTAGNVYAGCGDGLSVWNAGGVLLGKVLIPGGVTNLCFGKPGQLFLLNETRFWILTLAENVRGSLLRQAGLQDESGNTVQLPETETSRQSPLRRPPGRPKRNPQPAAQAVQTAQAGPVDLTQERDSEDDVDEDDSEDDEMHSLFEEGDEPPREQAPAASNTSGGPRNDTYGQPPLTSNTYGGPRNDMHGQPSSAGNMYGGPRSDMHSQPPPIGNTYGGPGNSILGQASSSMDNTYGPPRNEMHGHASSMANPYGAPTNEMRGHGSSMGNTYVGPSNATRGYAPPRGHSVWRVG